MNDLVELALRMDRQERLMTKLVSAMEEIRDILRDEVVLRPAPKKKRKFRFTWLGQGPKDHWSGRQ